MLRKEVFLIRVLSSIVGGRTILLQNLLLAKHLWVYETKSYTRDFYSTCRVRDQKARKMIEV